MILFKLILLFISPLSATDYFYPQSFTESRLAFREKGQELQQKTFPQLIMNSHSLSSQSIHGLSIDSLYIPQISNQKTHLLILTSGVHGAEAFAGSAIQHEFLNYLKNNKNILNKMGILIVHAVNPYGFSVNRRVTENNIDLNRNFTDKKKIFQRKRPEYEKLNEFLNPKEPLNYSSYTILKTYSKAVYLLLKHGRSALANAILGGQYSFPRGIYYGGDKPEENVSIVADLFKLIAKDYLNILHIDLHTGFGKKGTLHFFTTNNLPPPIKEARNKLFKGFNLDTGEKKNFYKISGEFTTFTMKLFPNKVVIPMTFEFGTSDSQTTLGALFSLRTSIFENQAFQYGTSSKDSSKETNDDFSELFNPKDYKWRNSTLRQGKETLKTLVHRFSDFKANR